MSFTRSLVLAIAGIAASIAAAPLHAQSFPAKPLRMVVPFPPGGPADIIARTVAVKLGDGLGQQVVIDNRGGGNGNIGAEQAARSAPDGYTIFLVPSALAANQRLYSKLPYSLDRDFTGVAGLAVFPLLLTAHPSLPVKTVRELVDLAKQKPGSLNYGSAGSGGGAHLAAETFRLATGLEVVHVPYKGTGPAVAGLLGGQVGFMFASVPSVIGHVRAGKLVPLAVSSAKRSSALPNIPTVAEAGVPGYELVSWFGIAVPAGTPADVVARLDTETAKVLGDADFLDRLKNEGGDPMPMGAAQFTRFIGTEVVRWGRIIDQTGAKLE
jgi:tripartite-type tricarboxylate transporter receptor subunit TctC